MPITRRATLAAVTLATLTAVLGVAACGASTRYLTDDLEQENGVFYVTCENESYPEDDKYELHVWLSDEQAKRHVKGVDCPAGPVKFVGASVTGNHTVVPAPPQTTTTTTTTTTPSGSAPGSGKPTGKTTPTPGTASTKPAVPTSASVKPTTR